MWTKNEISSPETDKLFAAKSASLIELGIISYKPCTPEDPTWIVNETQYDPRQNKNNKCKASQRFSTTVFGHLPYLQKHITSIMNS